MEGDFQKGQLVVCTSTLFVRLIMSMPFYIALYIKTQKRDFC